MVNYYFISDDMFYLSGLPDFIGGVTPGMNFISANNADEIRCFSPSINDVVVLIVSSHSLRRQLMRLMRKTHSCVSRMVIILDSCIKISPRDSFPLLLAKRIKPDEFITVIRKALQTEINHAPQTDRCRELFGKLSRGVAPNCIAKEYNIAEKTIYSFKKNMCEKYGLTKSNALATILCQDIIELTS
ncbi:LuxR C-terminal-related transcriptional regulator [Klebsiella sp. R445]